MTSDPPTTAHEPTARTPRLAMKPVAARGGPVDGAWWPGSTDPAVEFPALVEALAAHGAVRGISYHLNTWDRTGRTLTVGDAVVRLEGFHATQPDTVTLIWSDYTRTRLLVVPPLTPGGVARAVLRATSTSAASTPVEEILLGNGVTPHVNPSHPVSVPWARRATGAGNH